MTLDPNARMARTVGQLVPNLRQAGGYIRVTSTGGPVAAFALYGDTGLAFLVTVPPTEIGPVSGPSAAGAKAGASRPNPSIQAIPIRR